MIVNAPAGSKGKNEVRGCIDLGSTYARLLAVRGAPGRGAARGGEVLDRRVHVGWGADLLDRGRIGADAAGRAARAVELLVREARSFGCAEPAVLATNTLRTAPDRVEARRLVELRAGVRVRVLSGTGEAALGFLGASSVLADGTGAVMADPGGTSTEIAWGTAGAVAGTLSIGWGTHSVDRMLRRIPGRVSEAARRRAALVLAQEFGRSLEEARRGTADSSLPAAGVIPTILLTGGTAVAIAAVARYIRRAPALRIDHELREPVDLPVVAPRIIAGMRGTASRRFPVEAERRKLLLPGIVLVTAVARGLGSSRPTVTARDLRWGAVCMGEPLPEGWLADE